MKRIAIVVLMLAAVAGFTPRPQAGAATSACHPALTALTLAKPSVPGGAPVIATVRLSCAAAGATTVRLTGFRGATAPATVRVARGKTSGSAAVRTAVTHVTRHGPVGATLGRSHRSARLTITRTPRTCRMPALTGLAARALVYVGDRPVLTIRLSCAAAAPVRISLASSSSDLPVPAAITIGRYYGTAAITAVPKADQEGSYPATIRARLGSRSLTRTMTVDPGLSVVAIPPCSEPNCVFPDVLFTGIIPAGGLTVRLASSDPAITVPAAATFPAGSLGGGFTGVTVRPVTARTSVTISATLGGVTLRATTVLLPPWTTSDGLTIAPENGPGAIYGQEFSLEYIALLSNPAPAGGETVTFTASDPSIELETTTDDIGAGDDDAYVDIDTANVTRAIRAELHATVDGVTAATPITIEPGLDAFSNLPASVTGGDGFTATISLAGPVDTATTIDLQSTWGILSVPGSVTIPAGQSSASFAVTTVPVDSDDDVSIVAALGSATLESGSVTLTPPS